MQQGTGLGLRLGAATATTSTSQSSVMGYLSNTFDPSTMDTMKYVVYVLVIAVTVAVVILLTDHFIPFLPANPFGGPSAVARAGKKFWKTDAENLIVPASLSPTVTADSYTMNVQLMIGDSRTPSIGRYRHVLHRGSNPCGLTSTTAGPSGHAGVQIADIPSNAETSYKTLGLPAIMNPGLFLDKYRNDLHVFVHTKSHAGAIWLESVTIEDLPLKTPITVGVVCNGRTLEVYLNCRLYSTLLLKGTPYLPITSNQWFGRYCAFPMSGFVKDLQLWGAPLNSSDYMMICRSASFDKAELPPTCSSQQ